MSSAIGGLSAAKRRRSISQTANVNNSNRSQGLVSQHDANPNMIQVSPLEMLKMHESRLCRIEAMETKDPKMPDKQIPEIDELFQEVLSELDTSKKNADETSSAVRDLKTTLRLLQTQVTASARTLSNLQGEIASIKTELTTLKMATVSVSETTSEGILESVSEDDE